MHASWTAEEMHATDEFKQILALDFGDVTFFAGCDELLHAVFVRHIRLFLALRRLDVFEVIRCGIGERYARRCLLWSLCDQNSSFRGLKFQELAPRPIQHISFVGHRFARAGFSLSPLKVVRSLGGGLRPRP